jgi:ABC-type glycerol-3-phosphate transport system substrate-binding protein
MPLNHRRVCGVAVAVAALTLLAGCGGDDSSTTTTAAAAPAVTETTASGGGADAETTLRDYFTAIHTGDTETICALENDTLETFKYDATGQACLDDLSNQRAQAAIPAGDAIEIVDAQPGADSAAFVVSDPSGATINATLVRDGDGWVLDQFS